MRAVVAWMNGKALAILGQIVGERYCRSTGAGGGGRRRTRLRIAAFFILVRLLFAIGHSKHYINSSVFAVLNRTFCAAIRRMRPVLLRTGILAINAL